MNKTFTDAFNTITRIGVFNQFDHWKTYHGKCKIKDVNLLGGCHQDNILKHLKADYERLVEEAPTQDFKGKYFQEGQERIEELKMTMSLYNPALRRKKVDQVDGGELD